MVFCLQPRCLQASAYLRLKLLCVFVLFYYYYSFPKLHKAREA